MKAVRLHWTLHPDKSEGLYFDGNGKPRSPWYDKEIKSKQMSESAVARELDISYEISAEGVVFKEFRESHIMKDDYEINPFLPVYRFVDYGRVNACVFSQMTSGGQLVFFHEIVLSNSSTADQAKIIEAFSANLDCERFVDFGDPSGEWGDVNTGTPSIHIMHNHGIYPNSKAHKLAGPRRLTARNEMLKLKLSERIGGNECIMVHQSCQTTIDAFQSGYRYKETNDGSMSDVIDEKHPYEDVIDCVAGTVFELYSAAKPVKVDIERRKPRYKYAGR